jgi:antirestriction protein ArdC
MARNFERVDVYAKITNKIIADLEKGVRPWMKPWNADHLAEWSGVGLPLRQIGKPYRGINTVMLWYAAAVNGYKSRYWFTYKQAQALGGQVRYGETGEMIVFAKQSIKTETTTEGEDVEKKMSFLRGYTVFNGDQCDNLPAKYFEPPDAPVFTTKQRHEASEAFFAKTGALFVHRGNKAFYRQSGDFIQLPPFETFHDAESYAATKAHELIHWTLHPKRLNRDLSKTFPNESGKHVYAREELVAEIGAAFLCANLGITPEVREDHAAYVGSWLQVLKNDKRAIFNAASKAQEAVDYLIGLQGEPVAADELDEMETV